MDIEGVSEIFRRNKFDSKIEVTCSEEDKKQDSHVRNTQSITLFKPDITRKENDEYIINLKGRAPDQNKYWYKPWDEETIKNVVNQILPDISEVNVSNKKEENELLFTPKNPKIRKHKYTWTLTAVDTDSKFVRTYERFKSEFKDKRFENSSNLSIK